MTIHELLQAAGLTANDEIPIWDVDGTGEPTKKITAQQLAAAVVTLANLVTSVNNQTGAVSITPANIGAKATQAPISSPSASGTAVAFIDSITQNADGVITPTKKTVRSASQNESGLMSATDKAKLDGIAAGAQVNSLTGVKGNAESSYRTGNVNLTPANIGALALTGGTITGELTYKVNAIDASKTDNGVTSTQYPTTLIVRDSANRILMRNEANIYANGKIDAFWYVRNYNTSGELVAQKGIRLSMDKTGALTYTFSDPDKARSALGVTPANIGAVATSAIIDVAHGGTGATTPAGARANLEITPENIAFIGMNPTGGTSNDTREWWVNKGTCYAFIAGANQVNGQPEEYGILISIVAGSEVHQEWWTQPNGAHYHRGGNNSTSAMPGWTADDTNIITSVNGQTGAVSITPANIGAVPSVSLYQHDTNRATVWAEITKIPVGYAAPIFITDAGCSILTRAKLNTYLHGVITRTSPTTVAIVAVEAVTADAIYTWRITGLDTDNYTPEAITKYNGTII